jgi:hypothetical protein
MYHSELDLKKTYKLIVISLNVNYLQYFVKNLFSLKQGLRKGSYWLVSSFEIIIALNVKFRIGSKKNLQALCY